MQEPELFVIFASDMYKSDANSEIEKWAPKSLSRKIYYLLTF